MEELNADKQRLAKAETDAKHYRAMAEVLEPTHVQLLKDVLEKQNGYSNDQALNSARRIMKEGSPVVIGELVQASLGFYRRQVESANNNRVAENQYSAKIQQDMAAMQELERTMQGWNTTSSSSSSSSSVTFIPQPSFPNSSHPTGWMPSGPQPSLVQGSAKFADPNDLPLNPAFASIYDSLSYIK